jgi:hypothetical protein
MGMLRCICIIAGGTTACQPIAVENSTDGGLAKEAPHAVWLMASATISGSVPVTPESYWRYLIALPDDQDSPETHITRHEEDITRRDAVSIFREVSRAVGAGPRLWIWMARLTRRSKLGWESRQ